MAAPRKIIIDTDPGQDDAVAILLALASPDEIDVLGIVAVAGNVPLALTEKNARIICELARRRDVPVFAGCDKPLKRKLVTAEHVHAMEEVHVSQITSFFVGAESRATTLQLQRDIATSETEPMTAVIPGLALSEMWRGISYAEDGLRVISGFVVLVGILGMLVSIYTSLESRRREMAILRVLGAGPRRIVSLLVLEAGLLSAIGALLGVGLVYVGLIFLQPWLEGRFGLLVPIRAIDRVQMAYVGAVILLGFLAGLIPAVKAYRTALHDGLSVRV